MVKVIRFANEGFENYTHKLQVNGVEAEVIGCFIFLNKIFKEPLKYDKSVLKLNSDLEVKERKNDVKNIAQISEESYIYARIVDVDKLEAPETPDSICVQPELFLDTKEFKKIKVSEFIQIMKRYEEFEKALKKKAKETGKHLCFFNSPYYFYEAIADKHDII